MTTTPINLQLLPDCSLRIDWSDGCSSNTSVKALREACPCASCKEKVGHPPPMLPIIRPEEAQTLQIRAMRPIGNYAYGIAFSDGHDTGIYTLEYLHEVCNRA